MERTIVGGLARQLLRDADPRTDRKTIFLRRQTTAGTSRTETSSTVGEGTAARRRAVDGSSIVSAAAAGVGAESGSNIPSRDPPQRHLPLLNSSERLGRGAALLLFLVMVILAGVFIDASFTGGPTKSSSPAVPSISIPTPKISDNPIAHTAGIGNRGPSQAVAPEAPAAAPKAASPQPIAAGSMRGGAQTPVGRPQDSSSPSAQPTVAASPPGPPPAPAAPVRSSMASAPASRPAEPSGAAETPPRPAAAISRSQTPSEMRMPPATPTTSAPGRATEAAGSKLTATETELLLSRGDALLRSGNVTAARWLYQRGALAGDATGALRLGQAFDPMFLNRAHLRNARGDLGMAVFWYRRAQELGNAEAGVFLRNAEIVARSRWRATISLPNGQHFPRQFVRRMGRTHAAVP